MDTLWRPALGQQFGAAIDMLENAMIACPDDLWADRSQRPEFWYLVYHTLFWLDIYLSPSAAEFIPPPPFNLDELDPAGLLPERPFTKTELQSYFVHCRDKCKATIESMTDDQATERCGFAWLSCTVAELHLYNLRHVQHGAAQLNLILRQQTNSAPGWVKRATRTSA